MCFSFCSSTVQVTVMTFHLVNNIKPCNRQRSLFWIDAHYGFLLADLATGTVSKANEKHSSIPRPPAPVQQVSLYPKIDLKEIAKAVNVYRGVALKMLGEALEGAAEEKQEELSKKSHIPLPPATNILQRMGFPIGYVSTFVRKMNIIRCMLNSYKRRGNPVSYWLVSKGAV